MIIQKSFFYKCLLSLILFLLSTSCGPISVNDQLIYVASHGRSNSTQQYISRGADVNAKNRGGVTPLITACRSGDRTTVQLIIDSGAKINERDNKGATAMHHAASRGYKNIVELLLINHADPVVSG